MSMIINHHHRPQNATRDNDNQTVYSSVQEEVQQYVSGIQVIITTIVNHHRHHDNHQCFWHTGLQVLINFYHQRHQIHAYDQITISL